MKKTVSVIIKYHDCKGRIIRKYNNGETTETIWTASKAQELEVAIYRAHKYVSEKNFGCYVRFTF